MESKEVGRCQTVEMKISDLIPADYNPRHISDKAKQGLSNSISRFGLVQPIVWNKKTQSIVGGHQRLYDLQEKGVSVTDVVVVSLSSEEEKALNIALNHKGIQGEFKLDELKNLLAEVDKGSLDDLNLGKSDISYEDLQNSYTEESEEEEEEVAPTTRTVKVKNVLVEDKDSILLLLNESLKDYGYKADAY